MCKETLHSNLYRLGKNVVKGFWWIPDGYVLTSLHHKWTKFINSTTTSSTCAYISLQSPKNSTPFLGKRRIYINVLPFSKSKYHVFLYTYFESRQLLTIFISQIPKKKKKVKRYARSVHS